MQRLTLSQKRLLAGYQKLADLMNIEHKSLDIASLIQLIRKQLLMTQKQLAKRSGLSQSYIARLEAGEISPMQTTLKKVFLALSCDLVMIPIPKVNFEKIIKDQAEKIARKRINYLARTMALEKQLPDQDMLEALVKEEIKRLLTSKSQELWNDDDF